MTKDRFLTARWNNALALGLGLVLLLYAAAALALPEVSERAAFIGLTLLGVLY